MSAPELSLEPTKPVCLNSAEPAVPFSFSEESEELQTFHKLAFLLSSKGLSKVSVPAANLIEFIQKNRKEKSWKSSKSKTVLSVHLPARSVTVRGANGRLLATAAGSALPSMSPLSSAQLAQKATDSFHFPLPDHVCFFTAGVHMSDCEYSAVSVHDHDYHRRFADMVSENLQFVIVLMYLRLRAMFSTRFLVTCKQITVP